MNIYRHQFVCACPGNGQFIIYNLEIQSEAMIRVEHIVTACALFKQSFHEAIADDLYARFGQKQILKAHHHGVDIETRRGGGDNDRCDDQDSRHVGRIGKLLCWLGVHSFKVESRDDDREIIVYRCQRCQCGEIDDRSNWDGICG